MVVDLCDEKGSMKKLFENLESYADEFLVERDSFILIKVESKLDIMKLFIAALVTKIQVE